VEVNTISWEVFQTLRARSSDGGVGGDGGCGGGGGGGGGGSSSISSSRVVWKLRIRMLKSSGMNNGRWKRSYLSLQFEKKKMFAL
jgi:hypothetical protein